MNEEGVENAGAAVPGDRTDDPEAAASADPAGDAEPGAPADPAGDAEPAAPTSLGDGNGDAELVERAAQGEVGAFAVLVHRHAADLHARAGDMDAVRRAFQRAMRRLERADTDDVAGWLAGLLPRASRRSSAVRTDTTGSPGDGQDRDQPPIAPAADPAPGAAPPLPAHELDALWGELAPRWPRGRKPLRLPRWVGGLALVLLLLALAVIIPYLVVTTADGGQDLAPEPADQIEGVPLDDDAFDLTFEDAPDEPRDEPDEPTDEPDEPTDEPDEPTDEPDEPTDDADASASGHLEVAP